VETSHMTSYRNMMTVHNPAVQLLMKLGQVQVAVDVEMTHVILSLKTAIRLKKLV
jgi:hypothetical protein